MNCKTIMNLILLQDSGELGEADGNTLSLHLASCESCRHDQDQLASLRQSLVAVCPAPPGPSAATLEAIRSAARKPGHLHWAAWPVWRVALAVAAGLTLCVAGLRILAPQPARLTGTSVATEIVPLAALVMGEEASLETLATDSCPAALTDQLLILQGMQDDSREEWINELISPSDSFPTTLRWNNSSGPRPEKCG